MESILEIRKRIHEFIDTADDRILRIFNGIIDAEEHKEDEPSVLNGFMKNLIREKRDISVENQNHLPGRK